MPLQCGTQWDALSHIFYEGKMYNGHAQTRVSAYGAEVNSIDKLSDKVLGRGVLVDIPRMLGRQWLEPGEGIDATMLEQACDVQGVTIGRGDIVLVRTGHISMCRAKGDWDGYAGGDAPGINISGGCWLLDREIAALATDTWGMEVRPNEVAEVTQPLHIVMIVNAGLLVGEIFDLDPLARDCSLNGVYEFFFVGPPLPFSRAVGSPLNPLAIK
jgi:kynurenine formamidase